MSITGLILAAGESRRMGLPKALLPYRGESFLDTLTGLFAVFCDPVVVVLGAEAELIRSRARRPARFVYNERFEQGMTSSLQCGLREVPAESEGVLFTLVDHPAVSPGAIEALLAAPRPLLRVPRYNGERGHPIWFQRSLVSEFLALPTGAAANIVVRGHAADTEFLDLEDAGILADIDDPESYRNLTEP